MSPGDYDAALEEVLSRYGDSFAGKTFDEDATEPDDLMQVFGLTQAIKAENKQYWGRELGMCWELLVKQLVFSESENAGDAIKDGSDEICDLTLGTDAIDTKYRVGSGDSGTLKKFKQYGGRLKERGFRPVVLLLRDDNLPAAITAFRTGGWTVFSGASAFDYLKEATGVDLKEWLRARKDAYASPR